MDEGWNVVNREKRPVDQGQTPIRESFCLAGEVKRVARHTSTLARAT